MKINKKATSFLIATAAVITPVAFLCNTVNAYEDVTIVDGGMPEDAYVERYTDPTPADAAEESYWRGMTCDYYYKQFTTNEKKLYDSLDKACMYYLINDVDVSRVYADADTIDISSDDAYEVMVIFKFVNPQYFFLNSQSWFYYDSSGSHRRLTGIGMDVFDDLQKGSSRASARSTIKNTINGYITAASSGSRPEDMEVIVYRRICDNVTYDYDHVSDYDQSLYGGVLGLTVCTGYAKLFEAVMCKLGFECTLIENTTHAWNILKIHGQWYYVDTTWADQSWGVSYKYYNRNEPSEPLSDRYTAYLPKIKYDGLDQTDYNKYSSRYITSGSTTYFIISDLANPGRKVVPVYGSFSSLPSTISYNGVTYEVSLSEGESGWKQQGNDWYYYTAAGTPLKGWQKIKDEWYYLDPNTGAMKTGWLGLEGKWYYMIPSTGVMSTGWKQINNKWYFFDEEGVMVTGWKFSGGSYYYFNQDGDMVTGWKLINGKYYYFNNDGIMLTGWKHSGGSYYYLNQGGEMVTGWKYIGGKYYYFNTDGSMVTGWKPINGVWYYFNKDGDMATGWKYIDGAWYYLNSDGSMKTGWLSSGGHWYYLASNGKMLTGKQTIGGKTYDLGNDGILIENAA